jgi:signal transduction histidine kinase
VQLSKKTLRRSFALAVYLVLLVLGIIGLGLLVHRLGTEHSDDIGKVLFLAAAAIVLNVPEVRIDRGRLTLTAIAAGAAAILLNPIDAAAVGIISSVGLARRGPRPMVVNGILSGWIACVGSTVASELYQGSHLYLGPRIVVLVAAGAANWLTVGFALSIQRGEPLPTIMRHNFTPAFYSAFAYFALAALLISYVLDGSPEGYFLASVVCGLSLALTDTIAGRRVRRVLEEELSDADRHLFHSRAVEGVVHNLRNHIANALGYLREIDSRRLDPVDRESLETATAAANDAVTVLRDLSQGATPRVTFATEPVDLNELVSRAVGMARPRARTKEVQLAVRETADEVSVRADPLLMREVITNLLNNAIDAVAQGGRVEATTGKRANSPYFSIADNGPGVSDDERHHLFEPHFTTKEGGTGLGLFMSYGIVREHQGQLLFEGNRRGAVFTVVLPPFAAALALRA